MPKQFSKIYKVFLNLSCFPPCPASSLTKLYIPGINTGARNTELTLMSAISLRLYMSAFPSRQTCFSISFKYPSPPAPSLVLPVLGKLLPS